MEPFSQRVLQKENLWAKFKVVILTAETETNTEYEEAEFAGLDVELTVERP